METKLRTSKEETCAAEAELEAVSAELRSCQERHEAEVVVSAYNSKRRVKPGGIGPGGDCAAKAEE